MPIRQTLLIEEARRVYTPKSLSEALRQGAPTAFLSHSHKDATLAKGLQAHLARQGWDIYIDWEDTAMPDRPNRVTSDRIRRKIVDLELFLFLATQNSMASRWCPWELGYADGKKANRSILIIQTSDYAGTSYGNEYIELYRQIEPTQSGGIGSFYKGDDGKILRGVARP